MPIDYSIYPSNWKSEIRPDILERDNHKCKFCGIENYSVGYRDKDGKFYKIEYIIDALENNGYDFFAKGNELDNCWDKKGEPTKSIKIILTIMHLDHDITNNDYKNLATGCQKCHLNYDKDYHKKNTRNTINKKKKLQELNF